MDMIKKVANWKIKMPPAAAQQVTSESKSFFQIIYSLILPQNEED